MVHLLDNFLKFKNCIIMGDFNSEPESPKLAEFLESNLLYNHMKAKTCFKSERGSCIDLILSNQKFSLQHTSTWDTGLSEPFAVTEILTILLFLMIYLVL